MLGIISTALAIADATGLDDWIISKLTKSDSGAEALAKKVMAIAHTATGSRDKDEILNAVKTEPHINLKINELVEANRLELEMAAYSDRKDARKTYTVHNTQADKLAERIMAFNLPYICVALVLNVVAVYYLQDSGAVLAAISSVLGMAIKSLFDERMAVTGFYFGSSMGSKNKDRD